jgi:hypothetical protein
LPPLRQEEPDIASVDESFGCTGMFINWHEGLVGVLGTAAAFTASGVLYWKKSNDMKHMYKFKKVTQTTSNFVFEVK